jgi:putative ABC transport system substrate-binding protein
MGAKVLVFILAIAIFDFTHQAGAQQGGKVPRIGLLFSASPSASASRVKAFQLGLRELGYVEGKNIIVEYRSADGKLDPLPELAAELVRLKVDIIVTDTSNAIDVAKNATKTIPVVFTAAIDPVGDGQVSSLAKPGGNLTGLSILAPELNGKRLELLKEAFPKITHVAYLTRDSGSTGRGQQRFKEAEVAAKRLGLRLQFFGAKGADDLDNTFDAVKSAGAHALTFPPTTFLVTNRARIIDLATKSRLPAIYPSTAYPETGGLMGYGPDVVDNFHRAAAYVDKILKGAKPGDLPVEQPKKFELWINLNAAKQIGVTIPPTMLARADKVIK